MMLMAIRVFRSHFEITSEAVTSKLYFGISYPHGVVCLPQVCCAGTGIKGPLVREGEGR